MKFVTNWMGDSYWELNCDGDLGIAFNDSEIKSVEVSKMLLNNHYKIDRVIINKPATIIIWKDKTKTVVKCGENDYFNPEAGIALAYMKRVMFEDKTTQFNKWMNKQTEGYYYFL